MRVIHLQQQTKLNNNRATRPLKRVLDAASDGPGAGAVCAGVPALFVLGTWTCGGTKALGRCDYEIADAKPYDR